MYFMKCKCLQINTISGFVSNNCIKIGNGHSKYFTHLRSIESTCKWYSLVPCCYQNKAGFKTNNVTKFFDKRFNVGNNIHVFFHFIVGIKNVECFKGNWP